MSLTQARRQDSVTGGAEINFGGARAVYFVWIREEHGGTRNLSQSGSSEQGEKQRFKGIFRPKSQIQALFPAENRWSLKKKGLHWNCKGFYTRNRKFKQFFRPKTGDLQKIKVFIPKTSWNPLSVHKKTPIGASICTPVTPILLISSGHSPRLGGHSFCLGGYKQSFGGARPRYAPSWRRVCTNGVKKRNIEKLCH